MGLLTNEINNIIAKEEIGFSKIDLERYPTGLRYFDGRNCMYDAHKDQYIKGLSEGSLNVVIGKSGSGKTTWAIQTACHIAGKYENSQIIHLDFEHSSDYPRVLALSGWTKEVFDEKYKILNSGISTESFYKLCTTVKNIKTSKENRAKYEYDTGKKDSTGKPIMQLPPTIVIVDSIASMFSEKINEEEELSGQMSATATAKTNNQVIKRLIGSSTLEQANIIVIAINHITTSVDINPMVKSSADINYLGQNESMPGGKSFPYLANMLLKITARGKLDPNASSSSGSKYGIKGYISEFELIKSRTAPAGTKFEVIYSQAEGFLNDLTDLKNLSEAGYVSGSPRAYFFEELPDVKFTNKNFREVYKGSPELRELVARLANSHYESLVPKVMGAYESTGEDDLIEGESQLQFEDGTLITLVDKVNDVWKAEDGSLYNSQGEPVNI